VNINKDFIKSSVVGRMGVDEANDKPFKRRVVVVLLGELGDFVDQVLVKIFPLHCF